MEYLINQRLFIYKCPQRVFKKDAENRWFFFLISISGEVNIQNRNLKKCVTGFL